MGKITIWNNSLESFVSFDFIEDERGNYDVYVTAKHSCFTINKGFPASIEDLSSFKKLYSLFESNSLDEIRFQHSEVLTMCNEHILIKINANGCGHLDYSFFFKHGNSTVNIQFVSDQSFLSQTKECFETLNYEKSCDLNYLLEGNNCFRLKKLKDNLELNYYNIQMLIGVPVVNMETSIILYKDEYNGFKNGVLKLLEHKTSSVRFTPYNNFLSIDINRNSESIFNIDVDFSDSLMPQSSMELSFSTSNFAIDE